MTTASETPVETIAETLTERQRSFAWAYLFNPLIHGNGTACAKEADYKGSTNTLAVTASKLLSSDKIKRYLDALRAKKENETKDERDKALKILRDIRDDPGTPKHLKIKAVAQEAKICGWESQTIALETPQRRQELDQAKLDVARRAALLVYDTKRLPDGTLVPGPPEDLADRLQSTPDANGPPEALSEPTGDDSPTESTSAPTGP
jgi:phage terminase small subunit